MKTKKDWKRGREITLPSGNSALLRRPNTIAVAAGKTNAPDFFSSIITASFKGEDFDLLSLDAKKLAKFDDTLNWVCEQCFVEPQYSVTPNEEQLGPDDVDFEDKQAIFMFAMGAKGRALESFRPGQVESVEPAPESNNVPPAAEPHPEPAPEIPVASLAA